MFCQKCGKQLADGSAFCNYCGATQTIIPENMVEKTQSSPEKEGLSHKCPYCGDFLPFDALTCPSCGNEIRDKKSVESVNELVEKIKAEPDEEKRIQLIKLYTIPNSREAVFEFMMVAISQFDADFYASNPTANSIPAAWLTQIELCYKKGKTIFENPDDLDKLERLYNEVHGSQGSLTKAKKTREKFAFVGIAIAALGAILFLVGGGLKNVYVEMVGCVCIAGGIVIIVRSLRKQKTAKELEIEQEQRAKREQQKREAIERKQQLQQMQRK